MRRLRSSSPTWTRAAQGVPWDWVDVIDFTTLDNLQIPENVLSERFYRFELSPSVIQECVCNPDPTAAQRLTLGGNTGTLRMELFSSEVSNVDHRPTVEIVAGLAQ